MKKFLAGIAAAAIITVPMTSFALEAMSKGSLKKATAQAGVSIAIDNVVIYQSSQPTVTYWDNDGTSKASVDLNTLAPTYDTVGTINRAGIQIKHDAAAQKLITIGAILDGSVYGASEITAKFTPAAPATLPAGSEAPTNIGIVDETTLTTNIDVTTGSAMTTVPASVSGFPVDVTNPANKNFLHGISPLTIDVGTCQALSQGFMYNVKFMRAADAAAMSTNTATANLVGIEAAQNIAGVVIGLPTVEIKTYHSNDKKTISIAAASPVAADLDNHDGGSGAGNFDRQFIEIEKSGNSTMAILGGRLEIAPH